MKNERKCNKIENYPFKERYIEVKYKIKFPVKSAADSQAVVSQWLKKNGDSVQNGEMICRVSCLEQIYEIALNSNYSDLQILKGAGAIFKFSEPLAIISDSDEKITTQNSNERKNMETNNNAAANVVPILMPQAGQSMEEGTIVAWKVKEGDRIQVGQIILEIETDKATMEVEAVNAGRIAKIIAQQGKIVEVKQPIAYIADEGVDIDAYLKSGGQAVAEVSQKAPEEIADSQPTQTFADAAANSEAMRKRISPAARKIAAQKGIDLSKIATGTGPGGRIISNDLEDITASVNTTGKEAPKMSKMRQAIAQQLTYSKQNIPHFYLKIVVEAQKLFELYKKTKTQTPCSVNDFVVMACAKTIRQFPAFRSQYKNAQIIESDNVNIGIAVGLDDGLVVPVVVDADKMNLQSLAARSKAIVESARKGKLEGMGKGVFTVTNLGMFGIQEFQAIINPPESAILAVGAIREDIKIENAAMKFTRMMTMTLSVDHRVVDGVMAAKFAASVKEILENPEQLIK